MSGMTLLALDGGLPQVSYCETDNIITLLTVGFSQSLVIAFHCIVEFAVIWKRIALASPFYGILLNFLLHG
jgi:hypothetical protein